MEWARHKTNGLINVGGRDYSLEHLQDAWYEFHIPATSGREALDIELLVQYSSHCVSLGQPDQSFNFDTLGHDRLIVDAKGNPRLFVEERHEWSFMLPGIMSSLDKRKCFFTGYHNWLTVEFTEGGRSKPYEVFFSLTRQRSNRVLRAYVESAYVRDEVAPKPKSSFKKRDKINGHTLMAKKLRGETIRRPRGR